MKIFSLFMLLTAALAYGAQTVPLGQLIPATVAIGASGTVSTAVNTAGASLVGIQLPSSFTGTALTFQAATGASGTYQVVKASSGSSVSYTVAQGTYVSIDPKDFYGVQFLKVVSGTAEGGARSIVLMLKGM